ncbi:MAG: hypothetical protein ACXWC2_20230 [Ramlibacter sp.]
MTRSTRLACCLVPALLAGCSTTPHYDQHFGAAVREARAAMTANPGAGANPDPAAGIGGPAAAQAVERYHESFKAPPPVVNVINAGAAGAAK